MRLEVCDCDDCERVECEVRVESLGRDFAGSSSWPGGSLGFVCFNRSSCGSDVRSLVRATQPRGETLQRREMAGAAILLFNKFDF